MRMDLSGNKHVLRALIFMGVASESYRVKSKECVTSESWVVHFSLIADGNCDSFSIRDRCFSIRYLRKRLFFSPVPE